MNHHCTEGWVLVGRGFKECVTCGEVKDVRQEGCEHRWRTTRDGATCDRCGYALTGVTQ